MKTITLHRYTEEELILKQTEITHHPILKETRKISFVKLMHNPKGQCAELTGDVETLIGNLYKHEIITHTYNSAEELMINHKYISKEYVNTYKIINSHLYRICSLILKN